VLVVATVAIAWRAEPAAAAVPAKPNSGSLRSRAYYGIKFIRGWWRAL